MKTFIRSVLAAAVLAVAAGSANASVIDFNNGGGGAGGTLLINGSNISGSGIFINEVTISGAPINNGVFDVEGPAGCADALGGCGVLSFDTSVGPNGTINLFGSIPALGIVAPINLLTGDLSGGVIVNVNNGAAGGIFASGHDSKNPLLLQALGMDTQTQFNFFGFVLGFNESREGGPPYTVDSADIQNMSSGGTSGQNLVPEPGSLVLFGTGLFGAATKLRRRYSKKA